MYYFKFKGRKLYCERVCLEELAQTFGTPLYVYSYKTFVEHFLKIKKAFSKVSPLICYSVKANSNLSLLKILVDKGAGLDIVSGGELFRAKKINCPPQRIVYASVGKTEKEIKEAINYGILAFNVESLAELKRINSLAGKFKKKVDVALRFNPDISAYTHRYITTAKKGTKFGMASEVIREIILNRGNFPNLNIVGIHIHIGSQITKAGPFIRAIKKAKALIDYANRKGLFLNYFNIGGGLGIVYQKERPQTAESFAKKILPLVKGLKLKLILEPGRFIMGNAGVLITRIIYIKETPYKRFIIIDAGMNDLIRPALYSAYHQILPLSKSLKADSSAKLSDVVGPVCESADFLGKNRVLNVEEGDYLAVLGAGAYSFSMVSNYNSRCKPAEVLVKDKKFYLIRKRETYQDLIRKEILFEKF